MSKHIVCRVGEFQPGDVKIVEVDGREIGVFNVDGKFYALRNVCPHRGAPLCEGRITGEVKGPEPGRYEIEREGEIVRCPWHGYEFDITDGEFIVDSSKLRSMTYDVSVESSDEVEALIEREFGDADPRADTFPVSVKDSYVVLDV
jgi:3-phenylpropionate/trans-cinnamate dioxygenase ferredoxin subunit